MFSNNEQTYVSLLAPYSLSLTKMKVRLYVKELLQKRILKKKALSMPQLPSSPNRPNLPMCVFVTSSNFLLLQNKPPKTPQSP